jgi:uncharacterized protein (TIGR01777 family)
VGKCILITGASGLIGTHLSDLLHEKGHRIAHLSRTPRTGKARTFLWDIRRNQIDAEALNPADAIVHLAGENIGEKSWTKERKDEIVKSRISSTRLLHDALKQGNHNVKTFVAASAVGYYEANENDSAVDENGKRGSDFLAEVVHQWEETVDQISKLGIRVVKLRTGIVLSEKGGVLTEMMKPMKFYAGAQLGSGKQYLSWIHLDDLCSIYLKAIEDETLIGPYNAVGPNPVTNKEFTQLLARAMHRPLILPPVPSFMLKLLLGEMADLVLKGARVSSNKIQSTGYTFKFEKLEEALTDLLGKR